MSLFVPYELSIFLGFSSTFILSIQNISSIRPLPPDFSIVWESDLAELPHRESGSLATANQHQTVKRIQRKGSLPFTIDLVNHRIGWRPCSSLHHYSIHTFNYPRFLHLEAQSWLQILQGWVSFLALGFPGVWERGMSQLGRQEQ